MKTNVISPEDMLTLDRLSQNAVFVRKYLEEGIRVRTFAETLCQYAGLSGAKALRDKLIAGLADMPGEPSGDSLRRKVAMWLNGQSAPADRSQLVRIAFALGLSLSDAQNFMAATSDGCFHDRNPIELAYQFALCNRLSYSDALAVIEKIKPYTLGDTGTLTRYISQKTDRFASEEEFIRFIQNERVNLGTLHNTAHKYFMLYLSVLTNPSADYAVPERPYTVREVVKQYLIMPEKGESAIAKTLRKQWPDETFISRVVKRHIDVPRKVLALLFIATDGIDGVESESGDARELFYDRYKRINRMLDECGYSQLDPRSVFDWIVLYCMYADENVDINERMKTVLSELTAR